MNLSEIELPSNRKFGFTFSVIFLASTIFCILNRYSIGFVVSISLTFSLFFVTWLRPDSLTRLNRGWMYLGLFLNRIISPIAMGLIFFGVFAPIAYFMRVIGRDELRLRIRNRKSYWVTREQETQPTFFKKQF
jgi:hypothetical protein